MRRRATIHSSPSSDYSMPAILRRLVLLSFCPALLALPLLAQQPAAYSNQAQLASDLRRIGTEAEDLMNSMPSFTCNESAVSQAIHDGKVVRTVNMAGTVRGLRTPHGLLTEKYDYKHDHYLLFIPRIPPLFVSGGFATALGYFLPSVQPCYRYTLAPGRIDFIAPTDIAARSRCAETGLKGFALLNASGDVTHIERTLPPDVARRLKLATFASIDFAPVSLDGRIYQLSRHLIAEMPITLATGRFEATYTNCHRFAATVTLGSSSEIPSAASTPPH